MGNVGVPFLALFAREARPADFARISRRVVDFAVRETMMLTYEGDTAFKNCAISLSLRRHEQESCGPDASLALRGGGNMSDELASVNAMSLHIMEKMPRIMECSARTWGCPNSRVRKQGSELRPASLSSTPDTK